MQRLNSYLHSKNTPPYILNLDPAVTHMPYEANIDIRDTVDYREVMKQSVSELRGSLILYD
jgi:GTPase SAR1 family protein